eukprot:2357963-Ditylum_brightwellii.AAC.2
MMVKAGTFARYMAMAAEAQLEWVPTSAAVKPRVSLPMHVTAARMSTRSSVALILVILPLTNAVFTVQVCCAPGIAVTRCTVSAQRSAGQRVGSRDRCMGTVSPISLFFC